MPQTPEQVQAFSFNRSLSAEGRQRDKAKQADMGEELIKAFENGLREGFEKGLEKAKEIGQELEQVIQGLNRLRSDYYTRAEEEMVDLVFRIAEKVIHAEITVNPSSRMAIFSAALEKLKEQERVTIRISSSDYGMIQEALPALCEQNGITGSIALQEDPDIPPGNYIFESDQCAVDARIEKALERIKEALEAT